MRTSDRGKKERREQRGWSEVEGKEKRGLWGCCAEQSREKEKKVVGGWGGGRGRVAEQRERWGGRGRCAEMRESEVRWDGGGGGGAGQRESCGTDHSSFVEFLCWTLIAYFPLGIIQRLKKREKASLYLSLSLSTTLYISPPTLYLSPPTLYLSPPYSIYLSTSLYLSPPTSYLSPPTLCLSPLLSISPTLL